MHTVIDAMKRRTGTGIINQTALPMLAGSPGRLSFKRFLAIVARPTSRPKQINDNRNPKNLHNPLTFSQDLYVLFK